MYEIIHYTVVYNNSKIVNNLNKLTIQIMEIHIVREYVAAKMNAVALYALSFVI